MLVPWKTECVYFCLHLGFFTLIKLFQKKKISSYINDRVRFHPYSTKRINTSSHFQSQYGVSPFTTESNNVSSTMSKSETIEYTLNKSWV